MMRILFFIPLTCIAFNGWTMMENIEGSPENAEWRLQIILKDQSDQVRSQVSDAQHQAEAKKKIIEDRITGYKNAAALKQAEANYAVAGGDATTAPALNNENSAMAAVKWSASERNSSIIWLFILGITVALTMLVCAIVYETRRLRKKRAQIEEARLRQLELLQTRASQHKSI